MDQLTLKNHNKQLQYYINLYYEYKLLYNNLNSFNIRRYTKRRITTRYYFKYSLQYRYIESLITYQNKITDLILPLLLTWNLNKKRIKKTI